MYGSYGSYTSMSTMSAPWDISFRNVRSYDASCAFPSWPRRTSLSDPAHDEPRVTSFLYDDDLGLCDPSDDDSHSITSSSSVSYPWSYPPPSNLHPASRIKMPWRLQRERAARQREMVWLVKQEKERRRQMALQARRSSKKSPKPTKTACLATIAEAREVSLPNVCRPSMATIYKPSTPAPRRYILNHV